MKHLAALCSAFVLVLLAHQARAAHWPPFTQARAQTEPGDVDQLRAQVRRLTHRNHRLLRKLGRRERQVARLHRAMRAAVRFGPSGVARGFLCIHGGEGAWTDSGAPYWGGIQMDLSFQRTYGGPFLAALGTADHWPPFVQVAVGMRAYYSGRGFYPWPNTARACGLL